MDDKQEPIKREQSPSHHFDSSSKMASRQNSRQQSRDRGTQNVSKSPSPAVAQQPVQVEEMQDATDNVGEGSSHQGGEKNMLPGRSPSDHNLLTRTSAYNPNRSTSTQVISEPGEKYKQEAGLKSEEEIKEKFNDQEKKLLDKARKMFKTAMDQKPEITEQIVMQNIGDIVEMMAIPKMKTQYMQSGNSEIWINVQFLADGKEYKESELDYLVVKDNQIYTLGSVKSNSKAFKAKTDQDMYTQLRDYKQVKNEVIRKKLEKSENTLEITYTVIRNAEDQGEKKKISWYDFKKMPQSKEKLFVDLITPHEEGGGSKSQKMTSWTLDDLKQWLALENENYKELYIKQQRAKHQK